MAHEINNPLAFVANNLAVLQRDTHHFPTDPSLHEAAGVAAEQQPELHRRMRDLAEQIDLPYLRENLEGMLASSSMASSGSSRSCSTSGAFPSRPGHASRAHRPQCEHHLDTQPHSRLGGAESGGARCRSGATAAALCATPSRSTR